MKEFLRALPAVHELQKDKRFAEIIERLNVDEIYLTDVMKTVIDKIRKDILSGEWNGPVPGTESFIEKIFLPLTLLLLNVWNIH